MRSAQRILLRAQDGKPATFFVGDRYPIDFGLLSANIGPAATALASGILAGQLPQANYAVGTSPVALALGDFNRDGPTDLVVANHGDGTTNGTISVLLGVGDGTFATQTPITIPGLSLPAGSPSTLASTPSARGGRRFRWRRQSGHRRNGLGQWDLEILFGDGQGNFAEPTAATTYATGSTPVALLATDLNSDVTVDLAVVNQEDGVAKGTVSVFLNNATGSRTNIFAPRADYPVGVFPRPLSPGTSMATRARTLSSPIPEMARFPCCCRTPTDHRGSRNVLSLVPYATGAGPRASPLRISMWTENGSGRRQSGSQPWHGFHPSRRRGRNFSHAHGIFHRRRPTGIVAADFTGEGNADLAITDQTDNNLDMLVGNGDGTFTAPISLPSGNSPVAVVAADLNGDSATDAIVVNESADNVTVTLNTISSSLNSPASQTAYPSADYVDFGLKIKATPRLHSGDEVTLHLEFDIKSLAGSSVNGIPILTNRSLDQTVRLREDETSVLSGIVQNNEARSVSGLPWTSSVPSVGDLTGENTANNQQTEILILVTPRALRLPPRDAPALYAGHGEPSTPPGPIPQPVNGQAPPPQGPQGPPGGPAQGPPQGQQPVVTPGVGPQPGQQFPGGLQQQRTPPQQQ